MICHSSRCCAAVEPAIFPVLLHQPVFDLLGRILRQVLELFLGGFGITRPDHRPLIEGFKDGQLVRFRVQLGVLGVVPDRDIDDQHGLGRKNQRNTRNGKVVAFHTHPEVIIAAALIAAKAFGGGVGQRLDQLFLACLAAQRALDRVGGHGNVVDKVEITQRHRRLIEITRTVAGGKRQDRRQQNKHTQHRHPLSRALSRDTAAPGRVQSHDILDLPARAPILTI